MQTTQRIERALGALPPHIDSGSAPDLSEAVVLELDARLEEQQPELHGRVHGIAKHVFGEKVGELERDPSGALLVSDDQLRGCLAAAVLDATAAVVLITGEALADAHDFATAMLEPWDDPASSD